MGKAIGKMAGGIIGGVVGFFTGGPAGAAWGFAKGAAVGVFAGNSYDQQRANQKEMKAYHQNAENMYNEQLSQTRGEQARIAGESSRIRGEQRVQQANQQQRINRGLARSNRARHGAVFGDENDDRLGH
jgi:uncharacterized protein YcfJ